MQSIDDMEGVDPMTLGGDPEEELEDEVDEDEEELGGEDEEEGI